MTIFTATRLCPDNILFPDRLEIEDSNVTHYKRKILGCRSTVISRKNIASVFLNSYIIFADIVIETIGGKKIVATGFMKGDAITIVGLLT